MIDEKYKKSKDRFDSMPEFWGQRYLWLKSLEGVNPLKLYSEGIFRMDVMTVSYDIKTFYRDSVNDDWEEVKDDKDS